MRYHTSEGKGALQPSSCEDVRPHPKRVLSERLADSLARRARAGPRVGASMDFADDAHHVNSVQDRRSKRAA